jgi:4-carboxymuconolactone decarboxylase
MSQRFPQLKLEELNDQQRPLADKILTFSSIALGGPYNMLLRSPVLLKRMIEVFDYLRWNTSIPLNLNELAILIIARQWRSQVEWFAHAPIAQKAGLSPQIIAELKANKRPSGMAADEAVVYDFVTEVTTNHKVSDETFARARQVFSEQQVVDLTTVAGIYIAVAMILAMAEQTVPPGKEEPFKPGEP